MHSHLQLVAGAIGATALLACSRGVPARHDASDTSFAAMQERGKMAMGVDQYTSAHRFDILPNGGRIELQRGMDDSVGIRQIRAHLRLIQHAFQAGDFSTPEFVHMQTMPGTGVMTSKRDVIAYVYHDLPRGGELRMTTRDPEALKAIHAFMGAQRGEHHATGAGTEPLRRM